MGENKFTSVPKPAVNVLEAADRTTLENSLEQLFADESRVVSIIQNEGIQGMRRLDGGWESVKKEYITTGGIWEKFMERSLDICASTGKPHQPIIAAAAHLGTTFGTEPISNAPLFAPFMNWSHTVCHLFEQYELGDKEPSLLNMPEHHSAAEHLIDEGIKRAVAGDNLGNMGRILGPLIRYNIDHCAAATLDEPFSFKPASVANEAFIQLCEEYPKMTLFFEAATPRDYFVALVQLGEKLPLRTPQSQLEILGAIQNNLTLEEWKAYLLKYYKVNGEAGEVTLALLQANVAESELAQEQINGLYVDVDDTLIVNRSLNRNVVDKIQRAVNTGRKVVIFTGGNPETQALILGMFGFPAHLQEKIFPVQTKADYKGKVLEELIDDTDPAWQGFSAKTYHDATKL